MKRPRTSPAVLEYLAAKALDGDARAGAELAIAVQRTLAAERRARLRRWLTAGAAAAVGARRRKRAAATRPSLRIA